MTTVRYEGERLYGRPAVYTVDEDGRRRRLEQRVPLYFPDGFDWGYPGSGAANLALNLLVDALGEEATCTRCRGRRVYRGRPCADCQGMGIAWRVWACHHPFKWAYVAGLPETRWSLERADILAWYRRIGDAPEGARAC